MSQPPAYQWYPRDAIVATRALSLEQRGLYRELLDWSWDQDGLPTDHETLAALVGITPRRFTKLWPAIECKFEEVGGKLRNPRQESQRDELAALREKRAAAGRASAAQRSANT